MKLYLNKELLTYFHEKSFLEIHKAIFKKQKLSRTK